MKRVDELEPGDVFRWVDEWVEVVGVGPDPRGRSKKRPSWLIDVGIPLGPLHYYADEIVETKP